MLSEAERQRAASFYSEQDRRLFVRGRVMTRTVLGRALGIGPKVVEFRLNPHGKPELDGTNSDLSFNLSHSGDYVVLAVSRGRQVGVDIELQRPTTDLLSVARLYFCTREFQILEANPDRAKQLFFRYWTLKEAYLKAIGTGLSGELRSLDVSSVGESTPCCQEGVAGHVRTDILKAPPGYSAAIAANGRPWQLCVKRWIGREQFTDCLDWD